MLCFCALADLKQKLGCDAHEVLELLHRARFYSAKHALPARGPAPTLTVLPARLGNGAQASVYAGTVGDVSCAVRAPRFIHHPAVTDDVPRLLAELQTFVAVWTRLSPHPNVLCLLHVETKAMELGGTVYEAVPVYLCSGLCTASLEDVLLAAAASPGKRSRHFSLDQMQAIGAQLAAGLAHLHQSGHVYRDLKPDNILVAMSAASVVWKVGDLGLLGTDAAGSASRTLHGNRLYYAPEQWSVNRSNPRHARYSVQADVWSFGVLLLDMVDFVRFGARVASSDPRSARRIVPTLYKALKDAQGVLTDEHVWRHLRDYFLEASRTTTGPDVGALLADSTPLGTVLRQCLRVDPKARIRMHEAARLLRGDEAGEPPPEAAATAAAAMAADDGTSHGLVGPPDDENGDDGFHPVSVPGSLRTDLGGSQDAPASSQSALTATEKPRSASSGHGDPPAMLHSLPAPADGSHASRAPVQGTDVDGTEAECRSADVAEDLLLSHLS